jgi:hypothetical protein
MTTLPIKHVANTFLQADFRNGVAIRNAKENEHG